MSTYLFEYHFNHATYMFEMPAESREEAEERLLRLPHAKYVGELQMKIPANLGWLARLVCWWNNRKEWA